MNLKSQLEASLSPSQLRLIHLIADSAAQSGFPLYIIGGSVRDLILGSAIQDLDLTVEGDAIALARALAKRHGGRVTAHSKFGTAKWFLPKDLQTESSDTLDLISARSETYKHPAALPTVMPGSMDDDIRRRDFTINTLAIRLDGAHFGELRDDLGGMDDLKQGIVRVLHAKSFIDDPTRMYRAVRYAERYGFTIVEETLALIPPARPLIEKLSAQRIRHELDLILEEWNAAAMLARLAELNLLQPIHPALTFDESMRQRLTNLHTYRSLQHLSPWNITKGEQMRASDLGWLLWLMSLSQEQVSALNDRLHFTADLLAALFAASKMYAVQLSFVGLKPSQCVERLEAYPLAAVEAVGYAAKDPRVKECFDEYISKWRYIKPHINGDDLKALGVEPGPRYAILLRRLRNAWLDGEVKTKEEEKALLQTLLNSSSASP
ncbi:MAG: CCA tRNA nucleotidyltransferase [Chloroflexota bacterium]|nr:CCA tRNA nucleotidyltransferase [Chloroflexota bacterium]MBI5703717.1 CCA tRNA nucleotidyltransferase [Chloroflexota bacterium]